MPSLTPDQQDVIRWMTAIAVVAVLLIDLGLFVAWAWRKDDVDAGRARPLFAPRWSLVDVWVMAQAVIAVLLGLVLMVVVPLALLQPNLLLGRDASTSAALQWLMLLSLYPQNALFIAGPALLIRYKYGVRLSQIGFHWPLRRSDWRWGLLGGLALMAVAFCIEQGLGWLVRHALPGAESRALAEWTKALGNEAFIKGVRSPAAFAALLLGGGILAPLGEEFFFRGLLYNCGKRRFGPAWGAVLSAAAFALVHLGPLNVFIIFPMGLLLAYVYERTNSLWVTILMHAVNNSVGLLAAYYLPGV